MGGGGSVGGGGGGGGTGASAILLSTEGLMKVKNQFQCMNFCGLGFCSLIVQASFILIRNNNQV